MSEAELKERLLNLLERDREFRHAVAGLIGYGDLLKKMEEHDRKFNEILEELRRLREGQAEHSRRLEEHDRKFNEILEELRRLREDFQRLDMRVEVTIGSMGRRWGRDLERTTLEIFREVLEREGIEPGRVRKFRYRDADGEYTGRPGSVIDVDILIEDQRLYVVEVKSSAELDHVERLADKVPILERILNRKVDRVYLVAVNVDDDALERAEELGFRVIYGNVIRLEGG